ncbi:MAG: methyltransferase domain-containing protein [Alphaproteobacteria bacterium]|nr:methyltransferase domain-containing protein [Alphaproteobacteria bacterium]
MTRTDLGDKSDLEAIDTLLKVRGLSLIDVGCASGAQDRELVGKGASVLGVEPDPIQAEKNRAAEPMPGLSFVEARAQSLPAESGSVDGVFFFRSLHHVPVDRMDAALKEAARVLKPGGFLWIVEPGMTGTHFPVMRPFHDETAVRNAAQAALTRTAPGLFERAECFRYVQHPRYPDFAAFVARITGHTFNDIKRAQVETDEVRALFEQGRTKDGDYAFDQPMLLNLYRDPRRT